MSGSHQKIGYIVFEPLNIFMRSRGVTDVFAETAMFRQQLAMHRAIPPAIVQCKKYELIRASWFVAVDQRWPSFQQLIFLGTRSRMAYELHVM
jgi:hypothetical protein